MIFLTDQLPSYKGDRWPRCSVEFWFHLKMKAWLKQNCQGLQFLMTWNISTVTFFQQNASLTTDNGLNTATRVVLFKGLKLSYKRWYYINKIENISSLNARSRNISWDWRCGDRIRNHGPKMQRGSLHKTPDIKVKIILEECRQRQAIMHRLPL